MPWRLQRTDVRGRHRPPKTVHESYFLPRCLTSPTATTHVYMELMEPKKPLLASIITTFGKISPRFHCMTKSLFTQRRKLVKVFLQDGQNGNQQMHNFVRNNSKGKLSRFKDCLMNYDLKNWYVRAFLVVVVSSGKRKRKISWRSAKNLRSRRIKL